MEGHYQKEDKFTYVSLKELNKQFIYLLWL